MNLYTYSDSIDKLIRKNTKYASYSEYLLSDEWKLKRDAALRAANYVCSECHTKANLNVHHKTYERVGKERR